MDKTEEAKLVVKAAENPENRGINPATFSIKRTEE